MPWKGWQKWDLQFMDSFTMMKYYTKTYIYARKAISLQSYGEIWLFS